MWAARGPPRILRSAPGAVVCASADGVWKADVLLDAVHLRCYQIKDDYPAVYALDRPANPPIAAAFKAPRASRLAVLTETSLEMYLCANDIANGVTFTFALSITLGTWARCWRDVADACLRRHQRRRSRHDTGRERAAPLHWHVAWPHDGVSMGGSARGRPLCIAPRRPRQPPGVPRCRRGTQTTIHARKRGLMS